MPEQIRWYMPYSQMVLGVPLDAWCWATYTCAAPSMMGFVSSPYLHWAVQTQDAWMQISKCSYFSYEWHPSRFHPGCCRECGGPR
jgi:hypothetical protein